MLTPLEIERQKFKRAFRGYDCLEVVDFLDQVKEAYQELIEHNLGMEAQLKQLAAQEDCLGADAQPEVVEPDHEDETADESLQADQDEKEADGPSQESSSQEPAELAEGQEPMALETQAEQEVSDVEQAERSPQEEATLEETITEQKLYLEDLMECRDDIGEEIDELRLEVKVLRRQRRELRSGIAKTLQAHARMLNGGATCEAIVLRSQEDDGYDEGYRSRELPRSRRGLRKKVMEELEGSEAH